ncbi:hypothetical protein Pint_17507 [Pistacia integerrima]|uniref:Uncharacterized protein n=1 Tax=Pistacia integerrima TaxID=434235 RepID=A0ACC0YZ67_9ROSI|nr:hypothetical protein Pint_17507 [Pistacia integerrima]
MHAILLPKLNKVLMYDATVWRTSKIPLPPEKMPCCIANEETGELDCWCHFVLFDYETAKLTALKIEHDTWCSSGGLTVDGNLVSMGGNGKGANTVLNTSNLTRWWVHRVWGRGAFSYEYIPIEGQTNKNPTFLPLLQQTSDQFNAQTQFNIENNLYPFVHLSPDGNLFIFSNNRSILLDLKTNQVVREFPILPGGSRNYPASGMSILLPLRLKLGTLKKINAEVLVCGGAP